MDEMKRATLSLKDHKCTEQGNFCISWKPQVGELLWPNGTSSF